MKIVYEGAVETADLKTGREFRIPAITVTEQGSLLCSYECRTSRHNDWSIQKLGVRRSSDHGRTWSEIQYLGEDEEATYHNPTWIVDGQRVHLLYGKDYERVFHVYSEDDGIHFSKPVEITEAFISMQKVFEHNVIAIGPGHGIRLRSGRLLAPFWLANGAVKGRVREHYPSIVSVLYSDDHGEHWRCADASAIGKNGLQGDFLMNPSETEAVELADGRVLLNIRNENPCKRRAKAVSLDGGMTFEEPVFINELVDPTCFAGVSSKDGVHLYYVGCRNEKSRQDLVLMVSEDQGGSWSEECYISKPAGYADLCAGSKEIYVFYEEGSPEGILQLKLAVIEK